MFKSYRPKCPVSQTGDQWPLMAGHDCQHISRDGVRRADDFDFGTGKRGLAEFLQRRLNGAVDSRRPVTIVEFRYHVQEPNPFLGRLNPEGSLNWVAIGGKPLDEPAPSSICSPTTVL